MSSANKLFASSLCATFELDRGEAVVGPAERLRLGGLIAVGYFPFLVLNSLNYSIEGFVDLRIV